MNRQLLTLAVVAVAAIAVSVLATMQWMKHREPTNQQAGSDSRTSGVEQKVEQPRAREPVLYAESPAEAPLLAELPEENDSPAYPVSGSSSCVDSDANRGHDAIYVRGSIELRSASGTGLKNDHCRLNQLVEFSCLENPPGSGRYIENARLLDCPGGTECVSGECLR